MQLRSTSYICNIALLTTSITWTSCVFTFYQITVCFSVFHRPEQHGAELLAPLSHVLQTAVDEEGGAPCALALEGLYHLCEAEVSDSYE